MELHTISRISRQFDISTRTLHYYEQIGLISLNFNHVDLENIAPDDMQLDLLITI